MPSSQTVEIHRSPYTVEKSLGKPVPLELHPHIFECSNVITWALWLFYIVFQFNFARTVQNGAPHLIWRMWVALLAEVLLSFQEVVLAIDTILALFCAKEPRARPWYRLIGNSAPTIDVFITCCGEPADVVIDTVAAAGAQDYPSRRFRVFVLDDGHDEELQEALQLLSKQSSEKNGPQIRYLSRQSKAGAKSFFKAGNLQYGIEETECSDGSEFIASLDADMVPESDWLRRMIPHLILEDKMALACPPQRYYNVPNDDPLGQQAEFDVWSTIYGPLNDRLGAAMCTGSGFVVRRSALAAIGGWPLVDAGEDYMCSALLSNAGWKVAFIREDLQFGLCPETLRAHVKQRMRWADCGIEVHKQFGFYLPGSIITSKMTWAQRGVGILMALREYAPVTNILALILLPIVLYPTQSDDFTAIISSHDCYWLRRIFLAAFLAHKINNYIVYNHIGLRRVAKFQSNDIWCAPYTGTRCILSLFPTSTSTFQPSGSISSTANERSLSKRTPLPTRLLYPPLFLYLIYIIYASLPLILRLLAHPKSERASFFASTNRNGDLTDGCLFPFPGVILKLLDCTWKATVPLVYMTFPPTVEERERLIERDENGVKRPKKKSGMGRESEGVKWIWTNVWELGVIWLCA